MIQFQLDETPPTSSLPARDDLFTSPLPPSSRTSSFRGDVSVSNISRVPNTHPERLKRLEPPDGVKMNDESLLSMKPYRPFDAPSTPISNSPSSPSSPQAPQALLDLTEFLSSRGTSPDVTSSPSELSRRIDRPSSHASARSPPPVPNARRLSMSPPEVVDFEPRPGPEDAEGSTRRWSFRSRKANQLQPYRFDRLQYKRQLQGNPDAVVTALSPHRRRSSPGSTMDQDFIADDDEENTQETGEPSGLTITGEEESQSQSRDTHQPRRGVPSPGNSPPAQPPPQWYLDGMKEISDTESDDSGVAGYLTGRSHKKQPATEANNNDQIPSVSPK